MNNPRHIKIELDVKEMKRLRELGYTTKQAADYFGVSRNTIIRRGYCKLPYNNQCLQTYKRDTSIFKNIDSYDKGYWLGLLLTDGCIKSNGELVLELQERDKYLVERFRDFIGGNIPLRYREKDGSKTVILSSKSKAYLKDLKQWGIVPNKTYKEQNIPNINIEFMPDFIRGVFDGDGCISQRTRDKNKYNLFLTGRYRFIGLIQDYLFSNNLITFNTKLQFINNTKEFGRLNIYRQKDIYNLYKYMYNNKSKLCLTRKREKFKNVQA